MNPTKTFTCLVGVVLLALFVTSDVARAAVIAPSNGGNSNLHALGWQTFDNAGANNNSGISDNTPDSNSTFDSTPFGSNNGGHYLTGIIGAGASVLGRAGFGQNTANNFLQGPTFGSSTVGSAPFGINIVDVPDAGTETTPGTQQNQNGVNGSSWKFQTNGNQEFGDFSITNESDYIFRLERIHYDARRGAANSPQDLDVIYLASGSSNLIRASTGTEVPDLHVINASNFASAPSVQNISASVASSFAQPTAVRLFPGDSASFRFRWTNSGGAFAQSQIDNLAISGTFGILNGGNNFIELNPTSVPEPTALGLLAFGSMLVATRRRKTA